MPTVEKTTRTETRTLPPAPPMNPADATPEPVLVQTLSDFYDELTPEDWIGGEMYLYQREPTVTKLQGQFAYAEKYKEPVDENVIRARLPNAVRVGVIFKWPRSMKRPPKTYEFAIAPMPQVPNFNMGGQTTQIAIPSSDSKVIELADKLADKLDQARNPDAVRKAQELSMSLMHTGFNIALENARARDSDKTSVVDQLIALRTAGFLGNTQLGQATPDPTEAIVLRLKNEGVIKSHGDTGFDWAEQIKKLSETAMLLGFTRGETTAAGETWAGVLSRNIPDITKAAMYLGDKLVEAISLSRGGAPAPGATGPAPETIRRTQTAATNPGNGAAPAAGPSAEQVLDGFIKTKLVEMAGVGLEPGEIIGWIEITAPDLLTMIRGKSEAIVSGYFSADPILKQIVATDAGKAWLGAVLKEVNSD